MLSELPEANDPRLLVGGGTFDDAGVLRLSASQALVQSVDFFTPVVDDPYDFGRIAAANALSDIFAMGATPLCALAVCTFPVNTLPLAALRETLAGGLATLRAEGVVPLGGHTVKGPELTYGLAVTGLVDPAEIMRNGGARPGDRLVLTKPLGTGVLATALKREVLADRVYRVLVETMAGTNRLAAECCREVAVHALTDISGFGLLGHALEMAAASGVTFRVAASALPLLPGVREAVEAGMVPEGLIANREWAKDKVSFEGVDSIGIALACDPQTSGGLLAAVRPAETDALLAALADRGVSGTVIGEILAGVPGTGVLVR